MNAFSNFEPTYLNVEYFFFLVYRLVRGIVVFFRSLFTGFRGGNVDRLRSGYQSSGAIENCNPFLGQTCAAEGGASSGNFFSSLFGGTNAGFEGVTAFGTGLRVFLIIMLLFLLFVIVYSVVHWYEIKNASDKHIESLIPKEEGEKRDNPRWLHVQELIRSNNPTDWRMAVLEADTILEEMTKTLNIPGETLGERLKNVEQSDFLTLQKAWEAHKVRNQIAHQGSEFTLEYREALATIKLFEEVFHEFKYI